MARPTSAEMPQPSSRMVEVVVRMPVVKRMLAGEESQEAKSGVTFHTTAPVVPPARLEERTAGDWVMIRSWLLMVRSRVVALASTKPRFWEGWDWEKRRKASVGRGQRLFG